MKKTLYSFLVAGLLLCSGCESIFELDNDGRMTREEIFESYNLTMAYLNKCYSLMPNYCGVRYGGSFLDAYTDNAHDSNDVQNGNPFKFHAGQLTSSNHGLIDNLYATSWEAIRKCNVFLANIDEAKNMEVETDRNKWKGEALVMRAYVYWNLVKRYGPMPIVKEELPRDYDYSQQTRPDFYGAVKAIIEDCDLALQQPDLPWRLINDTDRGFMHKALAVAIKSEAILYAASPLWDPEKKHAAEAARTTKECLDILLEHGYAMYDPAETSTSVPAFGNYQRYFLLEPEMKETPTDTETIFADRSRIGEIWKQHGFPTNVVANTAKAGNCPSQDLVDAYETTDGVPVLDPLKPYSDEAHLVPNYNPANTLYDPAEPYANRDQRFYSTVFHDGAVRNLKDKTGVVNMYVGENSSVPNGNAAISETDYHRTRTGYYLRKFVHFESSNTNNKDGFMRIFRLAEMYLNYAEAEFYANGATKAAVDAVNVVRKRADLPGLPYDLSPALFEARLRNERRVEFAYEDHRFYDVRRWKILDRSEKTVTGMKIVKKTDGTLQYNRIRIRQTPGLAADKYLVRPIPFEQQKIYAMYGVEFQNPGW